MRQQKYKRKGKENNGNERKSKTRMSHKESHALKQVFGNRNTLSEHCKSVDHITNPKYSKIN